MVKGQTPDCPYYDKESKKSRLRPYIEGFKCQAEEFGFHLKRGKPAKIFLVESYHLQTFKFHESINFKKNFFFYRLGGQHLKKLVDHHYFINKRAF